MLLSGEKIGGLSVRQECIQFELMGIVDLYILKQSDGGGEEKAG